MGMTQRWDYKDEELPRLCAELGSITEVARQLRIPRPSLSAHIHKIGNEDLRSACERALIYGVTPEEVSSMAPPPWSGGEEVVKLPPRNEREQELVDRLHREMNDKVVPPDLSKSSEQIAEEDENERIVLQARERRIMEKLDKIRRENNQPITEIGEYPRNPPPSPTAPTVQGAGPRIDNQVDSIRRQAEEMFRAKAHRAKVKGDQHIHFPHGPIALIFVGDQHIGNAGTDVERMFAEQDMILSTPGAYVWQCGDEIDNFIIGKLMAENAKPSLPVWHQWELAEYYFNRWGDRLVAVTGGNHGAWTMKLTGVDYRRDITPEGVLYDGDEIQAEVHVGEASLRVISRHKWRGNSKYNPTHGQEVMAREIPDFDVYAGAHIHRGAMARDFVLKGQRKLAILSGTYKAHDDYGLQEGFAPSDSSTAVALIIHEDGSFFGCSNLSATLSYMQAVYGG